MIPKPHPPIVGNNQIRAEQCGDLNDACITDIEGFTEVNEHSGDTFIKTNNLNSMDSRGQVANTGCSDLA